MQFFGCVLSWLKLQSDCVSRYNSMALSSSLVIKTCHCALWLSLHCVLLHQSFPKKISLLPTNLFKMAIFASENIVQAVGGCLWLTVPYQPWSAKLEPQYWQLQHLPYAQMTLWYEYHPPKKKILWTLCRFPKLANTILFSYYIIFLHLDKYILEGI